VAPESVANLLGCDDRPLAGHTQASLLGNFHLNDRGGPVAIPVPAQRVVAFLALHAQPVRRSYLAGTLWPDSSDERAGASLRSALFKLRRPDAEVVLTTPVHVALNPDVAVDVHRMCALAHRIDSLSADEAASELTSAFQAELLPGWYDDWVILWQERWRQVRLHALEALSAVLVQSGCFLAATEAAMAAVQAEPLRDVANRALIQVHLAEGNTSEALRQYRRYQTLLQGELGIQPSPAMRTLIEGLTA
jgi:DNA-binding SARP family transcriptional activator